MAHIIHLEDDNPLQEIFKVAVQTYDPDIECLQFNNSDILLDFIQQDTNAKIQPGVFVLDIRVPGKLNGLEMAEKLREMDISLPIFVTSAYQKPNKSILTKLDLMWMPKPWHIVNATQTIVPFAYGTRPNLPKFDGKVE